MDVFNRLIKMHIVLFRPQIPHNTGAIGRTCLGYGAKLHLVGPLGFSLEDTQVKRAGLDYWHHVDREFYKDWESFEAAMPSLGNSYYFSKRGTVSLLDTKFDFHRTRPLISGKTENDQPKHGVALVFGSETSGFAEIHDILPQDRLIYLPMEDDSIRSFNLSCTASVAAWEAFRQFKHTYAQNPQAFQ